VSKNKPKDNTAVDGNVQQSPVVTVVNTPTPVVVPQAPQSPAVDGPPLGYVAIEDVKRALFLQDSIDAGYAELCRILFLDPQNRLNLTQLGNYMGSHLYNTNTKKKVILDLLKRHKWRVGLSSADTLVVPPQEKK